MILLLSIKTVGTTGCGGETHQSSCVFFFFFPSSLFFGSFLCRNSNNENNKTRKITVGSLLMVMTSTHTLTKTTTQDSFISGCHVWQLKITRKKILKSLTDTHSLCTKSVMSQTFGLQLMSEVQNGSVALLMVTYSLLKGKILWIVYHPSVRKYSGCFPIPMLDNSVGTPPPPPLCTHPPPYNALLWQNMCVCRRHVQNKVNK